MATTLYLRETSERVWWAGDQRGLTPTNLNGNLSTTRGATATTISQLGANGPVSIDLVRWSSLPLDTDVTISGSLTFNIWAWEGAMTVNAGIAVEFFRLQPDGTVTSIGKTAVTSELGTGSTAKTGSVTPTSTAFKAGDCLGIVVYMEDAGGTMTTAGSVSVVFGSPTASVSGDSFITTTETLSFATSAPTTQTIYLTDTASDANPGSNTEKKAQLGGSAPSSFTEVTNTAAGRTSGIQVTDTAGGTAVEWYTPQLQAVTIPGGRMQMRLEAHANSAGNNAGIRLDVYKTASDGTSGTLLGRHYLLHHGTITSYEVTSVANTSILYDLPWKAVTLVDGERLKFVLLLDDGFQGSLSSSGFPNVKYPAPSGTMSNGFNVTLTFDNGSPEPKIILNTALTELPTGTNAPATTATAAFAGVGATAKVAPQATTATVAFAGVNATATTGTAAPATTATFSFSGVDATTKSSPTAGTATVSFAGVGATAKSSPTAQTAAVTFSGVAAAPSIKPNAGTATVALAGVSATAKSSPTAGTAAFTLAGVNASPSTSVSRTAGTATFAVAGVDATAKVAPTAATAPVAFAGVNASAAVAPQATTATFAVAGVDATAVTGTLANAQTATFSLSGIAATAKVSASATTATMSFAAFGATVIDQPSAQTTTFSLAGVGATAKVAPTAQTAAFSFSGVNASVSTSVSRTAGTATFALAGVDATVSTSGTSSPTAQTATFTLSGVNAAVAESSNAQTASFSFAGVSASTSVKPNAGTASFTLAGVNATATDQPHAQTTTFTLTGVNASTSIAPHAGTSSFTLTGVDATVSTAGVASPVAQTAPMNFTAYDATVTIVGVIPPPEVAPGAIGKKRRQRSANEWHELEAEAIRQRLAREAQQAPLDAVAEAVYDEVATVPEPELAKVGWSWSRDEEEMLLLLT